MIIDLKLDLEDLKNSIRIAIEGNHEVSLVDIYSFMRQGFIYAVDNREFDKDEEFLKLIQQVKDNLPSWYLNGRKANGNKGV